MCSLVLQISCTNNSSYVNMDYALLSVLKNTKLCMVWISYDIACQWALNLHDRLNLMPADMKLPGELVTNFLVPKFHLPAHTPDCHGPYSFNWALGVGRTDGEGIERNWAWLNGLARSAVMMGAGGRWDTIDDFTAFFNFQKMVNLGR